MMHLLGANHYQFQDTTSIFENDDGDATMSKEAQLNLSSNHIVAYLDAVLRGDHSRFRDAFNRPVTSSVVSDPDSYVVENLSSADWLKVGALWSVPNNNESMGPEDTVNLKMDWTLRNGLNYSSLAILPYEHALRALPGYLQQTDMESNGKSVSSGGDKLDWLTAPVVFGQEGTNGQHAFMQLMHQSVDVIPTDFIVSLKGSSQYSEHHKVLVANCFAQSEALMQGKTLQQVESEMRVEGASDEDIKRLAVHKTMKGNTPSNTVVLESLNPHSLGALLALYEHKIFVQGVLWQLNSFDQWGVELGKQLGNQVLSVMEGKQSNNLSHSSQMLIKRFLNA